MIFFMDWYVEIQECDWSLSDQIMCSTFVCHCTLGNDDQHSGTATWHQYALNTILHLFFFQFYWHFSTIFLSIQHHNDLYTLSLYNTACSLSPVNFLVGTQNVFKLPPFKDVTIIHSLVSISSCVLPLFSCVSPSLLTHLPSTHAHRIAVHLVPLSTRLISHLSSPYFALYPSNLSQYILS